MQFEDDNFFIPDSQRSGDTTFVKRSEKYEMIPVAIWQAYPKPACNIFVGVSNLP